MLLLSAPDMPPPNLGDPYNLAQYVVVLVAGAYFGIRKIITSRKERGKPKPEPLPSDALAKPHPDPTVARLEADLARMDKRLESQQDQLDAADERDRENRTRIDGLEEEVRRFKDRFYWLRRIFQRFIDAWPNDHEMPHLNREEWELIGIEEDSVPPSKETKSV